MQDAVRLAHDSELPNDSRYVLVQAAVSAIADGAFDDADDARDAICEMAADISRLTNHELLLWFAANTGRLQDCDEAIDEYYGNWGPREPISDCLTAGYEYGARTVLSVLIQEIEENCLTVFNPDTDCRLILSDGHGIYIPQLYCAGMDEADAEAMGIDWADVMICQTGPDSELYWDSWQAILDFAEITEPATLSEEESLWRLVQNGDLFQVRADAEIPEEWF